MSLAIFGTMWKGLRDRIEIRASLVEKVDALDDVPVADIVQIRDGLLIFVFFAHVWHCKIWSLFDVRRIQDVEHSSPTVPEI